MEERRARQTAVERARTERRTAGLLYPDGAGSVSTRRAAWTMVSGSHPLRRSPPRHPKLAAPPELCDSGYRSRCTLGNAPCKTDDKYWRTCVSFTTQVTTFPRDSLNSLLIRWEFITPRYSLIQQNKYTSTRMLYRTNISFENRSTY